MFHYNHSHPFSAAVYGKNNVLLVYFPLVVIIVSLVLMNQLVVSSITHETNKIKVYVIYSVVFKKQNTGTIQKMDLVDLLHTVCVF